MFPSILNLPVYFWWWSVLGLSVFFTDWKVCLCFCVYCGASHQIYQIILYKTKELRNKQKSDTLVFVSGFVSVWFVSFILGKGGCFVCLKSAAICSHCLKTDELQRGSTTFLRYGTKMLYSGTTSVCIKCNLEKKYLLRVPEAVVYFTSVTCSFRVV